MFNTFQTKSICRQKNIFNKSNCDWKSQLSGILNLIHVHRVPDFKLQKKSLNLRFVLNRMFRIGSSTNIHWVFPNKSNFLIFANWLCKPLIFANLDYLIEPSLKYLRSITLGGKVIVIMYKIKVCYNVSIPLEIFRGFKKSKRMRF